MSVVDVKLGWSGDSYTDGDGAGKVAVYTVAVTDGVKDNEVKAVNARGIPRVGDPHPADDKLAVVSRTATRPAGPKLWHVEVRYGKAAGPELKPLAGGQIVRVEWGYSSSHEPIDIDLDGRPIANSAGEPFDGVTAEVCDTTLTVVREETTFDHVKADFYNRSVSSDGVFGWEPKTARVHISASRSSDGNSFSVKYEFAHRADGWQKRIMDRGRRTKAQQAAGPAAAQKDLRQLLDKDGIPLGRDVLLDGQGGRLAPGGKPVWLKFSLYLALSYKALNLEAAVKAYQGTRLAQIDLRARLKEFVGADTA